MTTSPYRVLVVDDEPAVRTLVGEELRQQGRHFTITTEPEQALSPLDGGEEFVVAPETTAQDAADFAEHLRTSICDRPLEVHGKAVEVTASFGVTGHEGFKVPEELSRPPTRPSIAPSPPAGTASRHPRSLPPASLEAGVRRE